MPEASIVRYLDVFVPWCVTVVLGHLILRTSSSSYIAASGLASRQMLVRVLGATAVAMALIVGADLFTNGDLFLRPRFPASQLLVAVIAVTALSAGLLVRTLGPLLRRPR